MEIKIHYTDIHAPPLVIPILGLAKEVLFIFLNGLELTNYSFIPVSKQVTVVGIIESGV